MYVGDFSLPPDGGSEGPDHHDNQMVIIAPTWSSESESSFGDTDSSASKLNNDETVSIWMMSHELGETTTHQPSMVDHMMSSHDLVSEAVLSPTSSSLRDHVMSHDQSSLPDDQGPFSSQSIMFIEITNPVDRSNSMASESMTIPDSTPEVSSLVPESTSDMPNSVPEATSDMPNSVPESPPPTTVPESTVVVVNSSVPSIEGPTGPTGSAGPTGGGGGGFNYMLILYVVPPLGAVMLCLMCVTIMLCCRRYRRWGT